MLKNLIASSLRLLYTKYVLFTTNDVKWRLSFLGVWMKSDSPLIVTVCMIFDSSFLDVIRMSKSTCSFLGQLGSRFFFLQNAFLWPMI